MPKLVVIKGPLKDQVFDLGSKEIVFCGRSPKMNDIAILELAVSRKHFKIFKIGKSYFVEDLNSKHGTQVNGKPIEPGEGFQINEGDLISIGNTVIQLLESDEGVSNLKTIQPLKEPSEDTSLEDAQRKERRSANELELVYNVSELLKKQLDLEDFLKEFLKLVLKALPRIDHASVFLSHSQNRNIKSMVEIVPDSQEKSTSRYKNEIISRVINEQKTVRMSNTEFELPQSFLEKDDTLEIKSAMCVPIISGDELHGAIYIESIKPYGFRKKDQFLLNSLVGPLAVAIEKNRLAGKALPNKENPILFRDKIINIFRRN